MTKYIFICEGPHRQVAIQNMTYHLYQNITHYKELHPETHFMFNMVSSPEEAKTLDIEKTDNVRCFIYPLNNAHTGRKHISKLHYETMAAVIDALNKAGIPDDRALFDIL
jgi:hypothetical protein